MDNEEAVGLLEEILGEEKQANEKLTDLADDTKQQALDGDSDEEDEEKTAVTGGKRKSS